MSPKVSVVIPVYNVEKYIERCLHSLFGQTLDNIEYIFVNDCSTDSSIDKISEILKLYPYRRDQTFVLNHNINRGVGAARTTGINAATGDYIIHCDPDDYVETDMYEKLYDKALDTNADMVVCYYYVEDQNRERIVRKKYARTPQECLENMYKRNCHCDCLWDKLVRRKLITQYNIVPYDGCNYAEDFYCVIKMLYYANSLAVVEQPLYHYCKRSDSITNTCKNEYYWNIRKEVIDKICDFLKDEQRYKMTCNQIRFYFKMQYRAVFVNREYEWFNTYKDSHKYILQYNDLPLKVRILWWFVLRNYKTYRFSKTFVRGI